jgi:hypothetical protein
VLQRSKSTAYVEVEVDEDGAVTETHVVVADGVDPVTGLGVAEADADDGVAGVPATDFAGGPNAE